MTPLRSSLLVALLATTSALAQESEGFAEVRASFFPGASGKAWQLVERVRPTLKSELSDRFRLVATIEAALAEGRRTDEEVRAAFAAAGLESLLPPPPAYANRALRIHSADDYLDVDRLYLDYYGEKLDLRVGRQALNWGSAQFFNPTDPFPQVLIAEPWRPRAGVNAARLNVPVDDDVDLSAVAALNDSLDEFRGAGRVRVKAGGTDIAFVGVYRGGRRNGLVGLDLKGTLVVGWWFEGAYVVGNNPHLELATGVDYSFPILERAVVFAQYYRNGAGLKDVAAARGLALLSGTSGAAAGASSQRDPFAPFVLGRDYGLLGVTLGVLPELSASLSALQNLNDGSGTAIPTVSYSVLDWLDVAASAQLPYSLWGDGGELNPSPEQLRFDAAGSTLDLSGLFPAATLTVWTRANF